MQLSFKRFPFIPNAGQVIYVESFYNKKLNLFIRENYEWVKAEFKRKGLTFCYFPMLAEEVIRYNAPYVSEDKIKSRAEGTPSLADFAITAEPIEPSLFFAIDVPLVDKNGNTILHYVKIETHWYRSTKSTFTEVVEKVKALQNSASLYYKRLREERERQEQLAKELELRRLREEEERKKRELMGLQAEEREEMPTIRFSCAPGPSANDEDECCEESTIRFSSVPKKKRKESETRFSCIHKSDKLELQEEDGGHVMFSSCNLDDVSVENLSKFIHDVDPNWLNRRESQPDKEKADNDFEQESQKIKDEIRDRVKTLKRMGVNLLFLQELINEQPLLSRLHITKDFRIFLVDYNELEIKMSMLPKAVFILFLRHPKGIRFKELSDYAQELLDIYTALRPNGTREMHLKSISDVTDSTKNSINEKCARIREAFVNHFDERLAQYYFVTGNRGEPKSITLRRDLVIWD